MMDVKRALETKKIEEKLIQTYKRALDRVDEEQRQTEKKFKPLTDAIEKQTTKPVTDALETLTKAVDDGLVKPVSTALTQLQARKTVGELPSANLPSVLETVDELQSKEEELQSKEEETFDDSIVTNIPANSIAQTPTYGIKAKHYLVNLNDPSFGLNMFTSRDGKTFFMIGNKVVEIQQDDLIVDGQTFEGTRGLWRLLTYNAPPQPDAYTKKDLESYRKLLIMSDAMYQGNDKNRKNPKSSSGEKWKSLIKNIWASLKSGEGIVRHNPNSKKELWISRDLKQVLDRVNFIHSEESAGNNSFHNDKMSLINYISNTLEEIVDTPEGIVQIANHIQILPKAGLSFFEHVKIPFDKGGFNITFTRNSDSPCIFRWKSKKTDGTEDPASLPQEGRIVIEEFYIRVPMIDFDKNDKVLIMQDLTEKKIINWNYRKWHCVELPNIGGKDTIEYNMSHLFTKGVSPIFVMVAFQTLPATIGAEGQLTDNSILTPMNVKNIHVTIDDESYPRMRQDFNTGYALAYNMYCDYMKTCVGGHDVLYSPNKFITDKCVYVIDTSKQVKNITSSAPNITLNVDFSRSVPDKTHMYIIAVSQSALKYDVLKDEVEK
ncbi:hypothetical protein GE061_002099 [Apolygus lucorum]|uniref:Uncharacterized protein n=1 Tax=Apolygus lucorum TaxID=248454 RepID=A0A8S9X5I4_APOLU|nr:hypothetical protein GE061_002099 [Apolygus lucorum]